MSAAQIAQEVEPVAWLTQSGALTTTEFTDAKTGALYGWTPLFTAPKAVNAELLDALRVITLACYLDGQNGSLGPYVDGSILDMACAAIKKAEGAKP